MKALLWQETMELKKQVLILFDFLMMMNNTRTASAFWACWASLRALYAA
jgi:hypothetical protein